MMPGLKLVVSCVYVLVLTLSSVAPSKDFLSADEIRDIEKFAGDVMGCVNIPGLALTVVRGASTFSTGMGVANMATGHPVDKRTIFNLGSASKAFVPYVLAEIMNGKENHDGKTTWGSSLKDILANHADIEVPLLWADTTLRDMLIYKSGSSAADMATMVGLPPNVTRPEIIRRLRLLPTNPEFRNSNHYSNVMHTVAGHLAEVMTGMSWAELMKAKVFDKLSMNSSSFAPDGFAVEDSALPYRFHVSKPGEQFPEQNISLFNLHPFEPAGALMSSAEDMSKWLRHLVRNLNVKGNDSGINMLIEDAFHLWINVPADHKEGALQHDSEVAIGYGMGWYASTYRGQRRFKYSGGLYAYHTQIWLFPDSYSAIFVSVNGPGLESSRRALDGILYHISDIVLRKPAWVTTDMICCCHEHEAYTESYNDLENQWRTQAQNLEKYVGTFGNGLIGNMNIEFNDAGSLILKIGRNFIGKLSPGLTESKLRFFSTGPLLNTEEWYSGVPIQFLHFSNHRVVNEDAHFHTVRIYLKEELFYDFHRGVRFESFLGLTDENDKKQQDGAWVDPRKRPVIDKNEESDGNDPRLTSGLDLESKGQIGSEGHHTYQPYGVEGQGDGHDLDGVKGASTAEERDHKVGKINPSSSKSRNTSCSINTTSILVLLVTTFTIVSIF